MRAMRLSTLLLLVWLAAGIAAAGQDFRAYETLRAGRRALRAQDRLKALKTFAAVVRSFPSTPEAAQAMLETARVHEERGDAAGAQAQFERAAQSAYPLWAAEAKLALGELRLKQKDYSAAAEAAQAVAEARAGDPLEGRAWVLLARVRAAQGRAAEAPSLVERAVALYPDARWVPSALLALAEIWRSTLHDEARMELTCRRLMLTFPLSPEAMEARYVLSLLPFHPDAGPTPEQIMHLEWLVALCPDHDLVARSIWLLSEAQRRAASHSSYGGRGIEAERVLRRYWQLDWPELKSWRPKAHLRLAELLRDRACDEQAAEELEALLKDYPNAPEAAQARQTLAAMQPQWVDLAAALRDAPAHLEWNGQSEFAAINVQETYQLNAPGFAAHEMTTRTLRIGLKAGWPYAAVWHRRVGIGWGPRVEGGRYLVSKEHLAKLLEPYKIEVAGAPAFDGPKSDVEQLLDRAHAMRDAHPHDAFRLYDEVVRKHPGTPQAAHARFDIARFKYDKAGNLGEARRRYLAVAADSPASDWAAHARIRVAEMDNSAGKVRRALAALRRASADFGGSPLRAEALLAQARIHSSQRNHARAQRVCDYIAGHYPAWDVAAEALQLAGYSGLWSQGSLESFGYFERLIADYPDTSEADDAVYYANWHSREPLRLLRDRAWSTAYDPEADRYLRVLGNGAAWFDPGNDLVQFLAAQRTVEAPVPAHLWRWRLWAAVSVAFHYQSVLRYDTMLDAIARIPQADLKQLPDQVQAVERMKETAHAHDYFPLNQKDPAAPPAGSLLWDGHSEEALFVADKGVRLHLREGDDFAWAGAEVGIYFRARVEKGDYLVSRMGLSYAVDRARPAGRP